MKKIVFFCVFFVMCYADCVENVEVFDFSKTCMHLQENTKDARNNDFLNAVNKYRKSIGLQEFVVRDFIDKQDIYTTLFFEFVVSKYDDIDSTLRFVFSQKTYKQIFFNSYFDTIVVDENDDEIKVYVFNDSINKQCKGSDDKLVDKFFNNQSKNVSLASGLCLNNKYLAYNALPQQRDFVFFGDGFFVVDGESLFGYPISVWGGSSIEIFNNNKPIKFKSLQEHKNNKTYHEIYPLDVIFGDIDVFVDGKKHSFHRKSVKNYIFLDINSIDKKTIYLKKDSEYFFVFFGIDKYGLSAEQDKNSFDIVALSDRSFKVHSSKYHLDSLKLIIKNAQMSLVSLDEKSQALMLDDDIKKIVSSEQFIQNGFYIK